MVRSVCKKCAVPRGRRIWRIFVFICTLLLVVAGLVMLLETQLLFFPTKHPDGADWHPTTIEYEEVEFTSSDGTPLHGWFVPRADARAAVLYCHGNAGNITHRVPILQDLHVTARVSVFIFDYRGYGRSGGRPGENGFYDDARSARNWLAAREGIDPGDVVLMGRSLGGAVAAELASTDGARALVLESTFTSVPNMMRLKFPYLPLAFLLRNRFETIRKIGDYRGPLLLSHGDADTLIPHEQSEQLLAAANAPKQLYTVPGGRHNDSQPPEYYAVLAEFLDRLPTVSTDSPRPGAAGR